MTLTPEQQQAVTGWITEGANLSVIQKKLSEQFQISMTYMDVRFLVDDLDLQLKDAAPVANARDLSKTAPPAQPGGPDVPGLREDLPPEDDFAEEEGPLPAEPATASSVRVEVDKVTLIPGAIASGSVVFSDGVTAKWIIDQQGRPGFTQVSQPDYRPTPADGQAFMQELSAALQKRGF